MDDPETREKLRQCIKSSSGVNKVPFPQLVEVTTGFGVSPIDITNAHDRLLIKQLRDSATHFIAYYKRTHQRFEGNRINEVGNRIEEVFVEELRKTKYAPTLLRSSGYPDIKIVDDDGSVTFLESKAVSKEWNSSFRSFYYTNGKKIDATGHHLLIAWKIAEERAKYWEVIDFEICDLYYLEIGLKLEFNANNKDLYSEKMRLI